MNIHSLNDYAENNNRGNNNNNGQNNNFFIAQMNPENSGGDSFMEQLFPKEIYKIKTISFLIICIKYSLNISSNNVSELVLSLLYCEYGLKYL